jgi:hypothetical protein
MSFRHARKLLEFLDQQAPELLELDAMYYLAFDVYTLLWFVTIIYSRSGHEIERTMVTQETQGFLYMFRSLRE